MSRKDMLPKEFLLLSREAELASMSLCAGLTALRKADTTHKGYYTQAFFSISTGLERLIKLVVILDYAVGNNGQYPGNKHLRKLGHKILPSFKKLKIVADKYGFEERYKNISNDPISLAALQVITEFAEGARYSNLDELADNKRFEDPIKSWQSHVGQLILKKYPSRKKRTQLDDMIDQAMMENSIIMIQGEHGKVIDNFAELRAFQQDAERMNKYGMRHLVEIIQMLTKLLATIGHVAQQRKRLCVPYFNEFFVPFNAPKQYWHNKKSWSPYA